jgi:hypothetical protein
MVEQIGQQDSFELDAEVHRESIAREPLMFSASFKVQA